MSPCCLHAPARPEIMPIAERVDRRMRTASHPLHQARQSVDSQDRSMGTTGIAVDWLVVRRIFRHIPDIVQSFASTFLGLGGAGLLDSLGLGSGLGLLGRGLLGGLGLHGLGLLGCGLLRDRLLGRHGRGALLRALASATTGLAAKHITQQSKF